jgi:hypothetical protein
VDQYFHSTRFLGDNQCNTCHASFPTQANLAVTFAGGSYNHKELVNGAQVNVTTCMECHERKRPTNHYVGQNCVGCHNVTGHVGVDWKGASGMPHGISGSTAGSTLACATCHGQGGSATTKLAVATSAHMGGTGNACIDCHKDFTGFKGSITNLQYAHSRSTAPLNDCKTCHNFSAGVINSYVDATFSLSQTKNVTGSFSGRSFTRNHTTSTADMNMSNCMACHKYALYSNTSNTAALRWKFSHNPSNPGVSNSKSSLGCAICH